MKISAILLLSLLSAADATGVGSLRGEESEVNAGLMCTLKGGSESILSILFCFCLVV